MHDSGLQPGFLPLSQAAAWAGVSVRTLRRWLTAGLPKYQAGLRGKVLVKPGDLEAFLTRQQAAPVALDRLVDETWQDLEAFTQRGRRSCRTYDTDS